jgi:hypothetical protein
MKTISLIKVIDLALNNPETMGFWANHDPASYYFVESTYTCNGIVNNVYDGGGFRIAGGGGSNSDNGNKSTIIDETGKVVDVIYDGDLGIYKLKKGQKWIRGKTDKNDLEKVGETLYWDEFIDPDDGQPKGKIDMGTS